MSELTGGWRGKHDHVVAEIIKEGISHTNFGIDGAEQIQVMPYIALVIDPPLYNALST